MGIEVLLLGIVVAWRALRGRRAVAGVLLALPLVASAADGADVRRPWYGGVGIFGVHNSAGATDMDRRLAADGYATSTTLRGQSRMGGSLFAGYSFDRFAAELGYVSLGEMRTRIAGNTPVDDTYLRAISRAHPRSGKGPQLSVLASVPLGERFDAFGRAGLFWWRNTQTAETAALGVRGSDRRFDPMLSLGLRYRLRDAWTLRASADLYRLDGEKLTTFGVGVSRAFADR